MEAKKEEMMGFLKKMKLKAKQIPTTVWIAGAILPGGLTAIAVYLAYKAMKKEPNKSFRECLDDLIKEGENEN